MNKKCAMYINNHSHHNYWFECKRFTFIIIHLQKKTSLLDLLIDSMRSQIQCLLLSGVLFTSPTHQSVFYCCYLDTTTTTTTRMMMMTRLMRMLLLGNSSNVCCRSDATITAAARCKKKKKTPSRAITYIVLFNDFK